MNISTRCHADVLVAHANGLLPKGQKASVDPLGNISVNKRVVLRQEAIRRDGVTERNLSDILAHENPETYAPLYRGRLPQTPVANTRGGDTNSGFFSDLYLRFCCGV